MKVPHLLCFLFLMAFLSQGESLTNITVDTSSVTFLKSELKNATLPDFFIKLALNETTCPVNNCGTNLSNVIQAAELFKFSSNILANTSKSFNITEVKLYQAIEKCNMTVNSTLFYLNAFETSFSEIYNNFIATLKTPESTILAVLNAVNVSSNQFFAALMFGNDLSRLKILSTGNYSFNNIKTVMNITNKTVTDMISCVPLDKVFKNVEKINSSKLFGFVNNLGVKSGHVKNFFSILNMTTDKFINFTAFAKIITHLNNYLNEDDALGTFISEREVITSTKAGLMQKYNNEFILNYTTVFVETQNKNKYKTRNISLGNEHFQKNVAVIYTETRFLGAPSKTELYYNATRVLNCTYVSTDLNKNLITEYFPNVYVGNASIIANKTKKTNFTLGGPLYCFNRIYGISTEENKTHVIFTKFNTNSTNTTISQTVKPNVSENNVGTSVYCNLVIILATIFIMRYVH